MTGVSRLSTFQRLARDTRTLENGCIVYTRYADKQGYARIWVAEKCEKLLVHRFAYELLVGPIPDGAEIDHTCSTRNCVNPRHLEAVTPLVNTRRAARGNHRKTHCKRGHAFTPENTYRRHDRNGRICRACGAMRARISRGATA